MKKLPPIEVLDDIAIELGEAFKLGCTLDHSIYDMFYVVLARRNSARLLTMDNKLKIAAHKAGVN
jgi:predicted nucleic acid-binding protein